MPTILPAVCAWCFSQMLVVVENNKTQNDDHVSTRVACLSLDKLLCVIERWMLCREWRWRSDREGQWWLSDFGWLREHGKNDLCLSCSYKFTDPHVCKVWVFYWVIMGWSKNETVPCYSYWQDYKLWTTLNCIDNWLAQYHARGTKQTDRQIDKYQKGMT